MSPALPAAYAVPFAELALANVVREYPNAPAHLYAGPEEPVAPRTLHPAFYGGTTGTRRCTCTGCSSASCAASPPPAIFRRPSPPGSARSSTAT